MASSSALSFAPLHLFLSSTPAPFTSSPTSPLTVHSLLSIALPSCHCLPTRSPLSVACSASSGAREARVEEDRNREVLQSYGLDPSEFEPKLSQRQRRSRREEERGKKGRRRTPLLPTPPEEPKPTRTTHKLLHVLAGKARRKKLLSPKGMDVRPMMELVRGAAFDIIQVAGGCPASLRPGRWLDLYSGTGSVGIEAISRGCLEAHFVEMDPWVVSEVLKPNLEWTGFLDLSVIHMTRVENFLQHAELSFGSDGSFDYISVTPPYTQVDYNTLMGQLENSPLVGKDTFILVEYPLRTSMSEACGYLLKIADRRFGRTHLAIYGPTWAQKKKKYETSSFSNPFKFISQR